jgi:hypothetical protein
MRWTLWRRAGSYPPDENAADPIIDQHRDVGARASWRHLVIRDDPAGVFALATRGARRRRPTNRSRMGNGMIQINAAARLPPKEFAQ